MASPTHEQEQEEHQSSPVKQWSDEQLSKMIAPPPADAEVVQPAENGPIDSLRDEEAPDASGDAMGDLYFEAAEHESVVFGVKLRNIHGVELPATDHECWTITAKDGASGVFGFFKKEQQVKLSFGRIIALAGDFYSSHENEDRTPICGAFSSNTLDVNTPAGFEAATRRFRSAVQSLKEDTDRNLVEISRLMDGENHGVHEAEERASKRNPTDPIHTISNAYHNHECGIPTNKQWWEATMGWNNPKAGLFAWLCFINADHFGDDAAIAYKVGHNEAMRLAREAGKKSSDAEKANGLQDAYMHEAFALHYLTDLFSSGHLRTPRRQLHNDNYTEQSMSAAGIAIGKGETPIWDFQANYMHDNDSDTGLLVRNSNGDQWLCYGDKQFKESWDVVNRARIMYCIQASLDELFYEGFQQNVEKNPTSFIALKHIPQPMLAAGRGPLTSWRNQGWGDYDMHNPAPLWQVNSEDSKDAWTMRAKINDHSVFERRDATPKCIGKKALVMPEASQECWDTRNSSFRNVGAAPSARPIDGLTSGGFLQIQDLMPPGKKIHSCINFWGPVSVGTYNRQGEVLENQTFTLRNRVIDFDVQNFTGQTIPLHSLRWHDGKTLSIYRVSFRPNSAERALYLSRWDIEDNSPAGLNEPVQFEPSHSWAFEVHNRFNDSVITQIPAPSHANLTRTIAGNFGEEGTLGIAVLSFSPGEAVYASLTTAEGNNKISTSLNVKGIYNFTKRLRSRNGADQVLLVAFNQTGANTEVSLARLSLASNQVATVEDTLLLSQTEGMSFSLLTGNILNSGGDKALIVLDGSAELVLNIHSFDTDAKEPIEKRIPQTLKLPLIRPYFNALIPTEQLDGTTSGMSLLQVSLHNVSNKPHLVFRLTNLTTFTTQTSKPVKDTLFSNPNYFHIKWLRCARSSSLQYSTSNALLEVFSFYGVLGIRLFAPTDETRVADYEEIGRLQYMAQTSVGVGLGSEGDWGNGILGWGVDEVEFIDLVEWREDGSGVVGKGAWGMRAADIDRPLIGGWEVTRRPGYSS